MGQMSTYLWEIQENDQIIFFQTVAHEFGHNLGMEHDFTDEGQTFPRYDANNKRLAHWKGFCLEGPSIREDVQ